MVEGEDHDRNSQPQRHPQAVAGRVCRAKGQGFQRRTAPLRDEVQSQQHQGCNEREHQNTHRLNNHLLTEANDGHHTDDQNQRQNRTRRRSHLQLVRHEAFYGVGDGYAVDQQNRVDSEEVEQGNQFTCAYAEVFFNHFRDVFARIFTGQHEAGQAAVCEESHREGKDCHDNQRDHTADACVDRQEQNARADCCTVQTQHPHGICFAPSASGLC